MDCGTPEMTRLLRSLLEGLGVDPNDLQVQIGVRQPGEPGRPRAEDARGPEETKTDTARVAGRLLEALTSLCQAGERFVDSAAEPISAKTPENPPRCHVPLNRCVT